MEVTGDGRLHCYTTNEPGQTDTLMEVYKFRSVLTEVTGDRTYICIRLFLSIVILLQKVI